LIVEHRRIILLLNPIDRGILEFCFVRHEHQT